MNIELIDSIEKSNVKVLNDLINKKVNVNIIDKYGDPLLILALHKKNEDIIKILLGTNLDVNLADKNGQTALHFAAYYGLYDIAKVLLDKGGDLGIEDVYGNEPLWTAVFNDKGRGSRIEIIKLFLENGADKNHKNKVGKSPYDIVYIAGYDNLKSLFK